MSARTSSFRRRWLVPMLLLTSAALAIFWSLYAFDRFFSGARAGSALFDYLAFDPVTLTDAVSALAGMNAAVFGIVVTVVSIIVQLSADRYTGVARMFL